MDARNGLEQVGKLRLKNQGGFVVKLDFEYYDMNHKQVRVHGSRKDITLGCSETSDPGDYGIKDGQEFTVHADVVAGRDNTGSTWFIYKKGCATTAKFTISGTTLDNELGFNGYEQ